MITLLLQMVMLCAREVAVSRFAGEQYMSARYGSTSGAYTFAYLVRGR